MPTFLCLAAGLACFPPPIPPDRKPEVAPSIQVHREAPLSPAQPRDERTCAWYGEAADGVLYFGQAAFWSSFRASGGDPAADLALPGPRRIGRFDLELRQMLEPLDVGPRPDGRPGRAGIWDVLPLRGRLYFTSPFEGAGFIDLASGAVQHFPDSVLWNEIAVGPLVSNLEGYSTTAEETLLFSRYADRAKGGGAVVVTDLDGQVLRTLVLEPPETGALAAKTPAWDPVTRTIWVTTDRLPLPETGAGEAAFAHPTVVLDLYGDELGRYGTPTEPLEVQFIRFDLQGLGYAAFHRQGRLELAVLQPGASRRRLEAATTAILDPDFAPGFDFAQDIHIGPDGSAWVTRWSGNIHRVTPRTGQVRSWQLPRPKDALYYTAVPAGGTGAVCATRCADVEVVCASPGAAGTR